LEKIAPDYALSVVLKNNRDATVPEIYLVQNTSLLVPIRAVIHAMLRLGAWRHLFATIFMNWVRTPRWRATIIAATWLLIFAAMPGHRRRLPPFIHDIVDLTALLSRRDVSNP
jgi:hypothetical protein